MLPSQPLVGLCAHVSTFHGRADDLAAVGRMCAGSRLLTIVGEPGVGKSRLAVELARTLSDSGAAMVFHVDVGALDADEPAVVRAIAVAADITGAPNEPLIDTVIAAFGSAHESRLVLDNCEHRLEDCGALLATMLPQCPRLRVLATSREVLRLPGESVYSLAGLAVPCGAAESPAGDGQTAAVRLFVDRARAARHDFELTAIGSDAVDTICARLDGNPLAIELAAALVRVLSPMEILDGLADRFGLLDSGWRTADERHRSLRAAIDWSYQRLAPYERAVLRRIAVLPPCFALETAVAVVMVARETPDPGAPATMRSRRALPVLQALRRLEARSLLIAERGATEGTRFRLTESIRLFALDCADDDAERQLAEDGLVGFLARLAKPLCDAIIEPDPVVARLVEERDNLLRGLQVLADRPDERRLVLAVGLLAVEDFDGQDHGGRAALAEALRDISPAAEYRDAALAVAALLAGRDGDDRTAARFADDAVDSADQRGDHRALARHLRVRAATGALGGDLESAVEDVTRALDLSAALGDERAVLCCRADLAGYALGQGDVGRAADIVAAIQAVGAQDTADLRPAAFGSARLDAGSATQTAMLLYTAGAVELRRDNTEAATACFTHGLSLAGTGRWHVPWGLEAMAAVARTTRRPERGLRLLGAATQLRALARNRAAPWWRTWIAEVRADSARSLSTSRVSAAVRAGRAMSADEAVDYALHGRHQPAEPRSSISGREGQVIDLIARGMTNRQIAERLHISVRTVETHIRNIREQHQLRSRAHVAAWSVKRQLPVRDQGVRMLPSLPATTPEPARPQPNGPP